MDILAKWYIFNITDNTLSDYNSSIRIKANTESEARLKLIERHRTAYNTTLSIDDIDKKYNFKGTQSFMFVSSVEIMPSFLESSSDSSKVPVIYEYKVIGDNLEDYGDYNRGELYSNQDINDWLVERHLAIYGTIIPKECVNEFYEVIGIISEEVLNSGTVCSCGRISGAERVIIRDGKTDNYLYSDCLCQECQEELKQDGFNIESV